MTRRSLFVIAMLLFSIPAVADGARRLDTNIFLGYGVSQPNYHGQGKFTSVAAERVGFTPRFLAKHFPSLRTGLAVAYSDVVQPRSWFGHRYGDPDDRVRAEWGEIFVRRIWREGDLVRPVIDFGSGPMWSNRRVPAATSRFNFHSQLGMGIAFGRMPARPLYVIYRYSHISNLVFGPRNPGYNVHTILLGTRLTR